MTAVATGDDRDAGDVGILTSTKEDACRQRQVNDRRAPSGGSAPPLRQVEPAGGGRSMGGGRGRASPAEPGVDFAEVLLR